MSKIKLLLTSFVVTLMLGAVTSCATNPATSTRPYQPPTVTCDEHASVSRLSLYPVAPRLDYGSGSDALAAYRTASDADRTRIVDQLSSDLDASLGYSAEQSGWAIRTAGVVRNDAIARNTTASCLDAYRAAGVIK